MYDYLTTNQYFIRRIFSDPNITIKYMELRAKPSFFCLPKDHEILKDVAELKKLRESLQTSFASFKTIDRLLESISKLGTLGTDKNLILSHLLDASRYFGNNTFVLDDVIDEEVKMTNLLQNTIVILKCPIGFILKVMSQKSTF